MFKYFIDKEQNIAWLSSHRNGSNTLQRVAEDVPNLIAVEMNEFFRFVDTDTTIPIFVIFRDPEVRFKSGLPFAMSNRTGVLPESDYPTYYRFRTMLSSFNSLSDTHLKAMFPSLQIYHLFDSHTDHTLWAPALLACFGYNVRLIPMYDYTKILIDKYPQTIKSQYHYSRHLSRPDSFDKTLNKHDILWDIYKEVIIKDNTFYDWMKLEKEIFQIYKNTHEQKDIKEISNNVIQLILEDPFYLTDIHSPKVCMINIFLNYLHANYGTSISKLSCYNQEYNKNKENIHKLCFKQY